MPSANTCSPFVTSAPGKVIVFGEHAVVHGKSAIAAAISLRSYLHVQPVPDTNTVVSLCCPDIGLDHVWNLDDLPLGRFQTVAETPPRALNPDLLAALLPRVHHFSSDERASDMRRVAALSFLYLYSSLMPSQRAGTRYTLRSNIPVGAGLGSSASISVCIAAALLLQNEQVRFPQHRADVDLRSLSLINDWAFVGEMCIHGNPSGVDNTVSSFGRAVVFQRDNYTLPPTIEHLPQFPQLPLLLVNTNVSRSTAVEVAKVGALKERLPDVTTKLLDAIDQVTMTARGLIQTLQDGTYESLGLLININHGLLVALGVSHPRLERIRELVAVADVGYTKLTGAGGGGSAITLLKPSVPTAVSHQLDRQLEAEGFQRYETTLAGHGAGVLRTSNCMFQAFINAKTACELDQVLNLGPEQWQFWQSS